MFVPFWLTRYVSVLIDVYIDTFVFNGGSNSFQPCLTGSNQLLLL